MIYLDWMDFGPYRSCPGRQQQNGGENLRRKDAMKAAWIAVIFWLMIGSLFFLPAVCLAKGTDMTPKKDTAAGNSAGNGGPVMKAEVGFDGTYRIGCWTPVRIFLENSGADLEGTLEVPITGESGKKTAYGVPVRLPHASSQEYTIYVKMQKLNRSLDIRLMDDKEKVVKEGKAEKLNPVSADHYFLGLVTGDEPSLGYWKERSEGDLLLANYQPVSLTAENFPDHREVLDSFSILILNQVNTGSFRPEQIRALNAWIQSGGILIIGTGGNGSRTLAGLTEEIVPAAAGDVTEQDAAAELEKVSGKPIRGSSALDVMDVRIEGGTVAVSRNAGSDSAPEDADQAGGLVWMHRKGSGVMYTAAFDLGTEPVLSWAGNKIFWEKLLERSLPEQSIQLLQDPNQSIGEGSGMEEILGNIEAMHLPSVTSVLPIFLLYLVLIGPVNYMILKRADRREWSWFTIPVLSVVFALAIYGLGYRSKGGELILNTISVVELNDDSGGGDRTDYMGVFLPRRGDYRVDVDREVFLSANGGENDDSFPHAGNAAPDVHMIQGKPSRILFRNSSVWNMKTFRADPRRVDYGSLHADLRYEAGKIVGTVQNNTLYPLEDFVLYNASFHGKAGNIASGETKKVEIMLPTKGVAAAPGDYQSMLDSLYPEWSGGRRASRRDRNRYRILQNLFADDGMQKSSPKQTGDSCRLQCFAFYGKDPDEAIKINGRKPDVIMGEGVLLGSVGFEAEQDGHVSLPPGMLNGRLEQEQSRGAGIYGNPTAVSIDDPHGYAVFSMDLSRYRDRKDLEGKIGLGVLSGRSRVMIFDLSKKDYVRMEDGVLSLDGSSLSRYVDESGMVRLKVQPVTDEPVEFTLPTVTLEGGLQDAEN
jgi:hypothetical protein